MTANGNHTYFYDAENRLTQVDGTLGTCSTATACYVYDALGRRVKRSTSAGEIDYLYDLAGNVVTEWDVNVGGYTGDAVNYVYFNGPLLAEYKNSTTYFFHGDHLGSARLVTGVNQTVVQNLDFLPFGEINSSDSGITTHEFTGDERDGETSFDHTQFRQYTSQLARWITPDPAGLAAVDPTNPQSWNRYSYALDDPIDYVDPSGLCVHMLFDNATCADGFYFGGGLSPTCIVDGADVGCDQLFQLFHGDKFAALQLALKPTSVQLVPDSSPVCMQTGDCGSGYITYQYGNIGLLSFLGAYPGSGNSGWWSRFTNWLKNRPITVNVTLPLTLIGIPIPIGPAFTGAIIPGSNWGCGGLGVGAAVPFGAEFGSMLVGKGDPKAVLSGWGVSVSLVGPPGAGGAVTGNKSGFLAGLAAGVPGLGGSITHSWCGTLLAGHGPS